MQQSSKIALGFAMLAIAGLLVYFALHQPQPSDQEQILAQINTARQAAEAHNVGGVMAEVSADYHGHSDVDSNVDSLHFLLGRIVGKSNDYAITMSDPTITIQGSTATSVGHITIRDRASSQIQYDQNITLHWKREPGHRDLVLPADVWRIVSVDAPFPAE